MSDNSYLEQWKYLNDVAISDIVIPKYKQGINEVTIKQITRQQHCETKSTNKNTSTKEKYSMPSNQSNKSFWSEIRNDYIDESDLNDGSVEMTIDAYKTDDDNEQGSSIAKILAIKTDNSNQNIVKVIYIDNIARGDKYAQEIITEGIGIMKAYEFPKQNEPARLKWSNSITCPHCHTEQMDGLDNLVEVGDMEGSFEHPCESCGEPFIVTFEYRPYTLTKKAGDEN